MQIAEETLFPSTKGEKCHWSRNAYVYTNIPGKGIVSEFSGGCPTTGKNAGRISITVFIDQVDCLVKGIDIDNTEDGFKNFSLVILAFRACISQYVGTNKIATLKTSNS